MMKREALTKLEGMSWDWRDATLNLIAIAQGEALPFTASRPLQIIASKGYAVQTTNGPALTVVGLDYLRQVFS
jgi:hypothetical protein